MQFRRVRSGDPLSIDARDQNAWQDTAKRDQRQRLQFLMPPHNSAGRKCVVKITSNASGGEKYNGRVLTGTSTAVATGNVALPEGLTVPASDDALIINANGDGKSSHSITANAILPGQIIGTTSDGLKIVLVQGGFTGTKTRVTAVSYNTTTHVLSYSSATDTYVNGALISSVSNSDTTVDTAVTCS